MSTTLFQVDAFADRPFAGNPAAVCPLQEPRAARWMQAVALEMNLSETAFVVPRDGGGFGLRWFTPAAEVELCGHATLASAHVLWETGVVGGNESIEFDTQSGRLHAVRAGDFIELDFPATPASSIDPLPALPEALGVDAAWMGKTRFDYLVLVDAAATVRGATPDFARLRELGVRGIMLTAAETADGHDFVSRFFAPGVGVDEDPVTGSAHCALGPFWAERLGKTEVTGYQASARGGTVRVRVRGDRVDLAGRALTVMKAELLVPDA